MDLVYEFLVNKIKLNKDSKIVIGVSTGPDSMCLLNILLNLQEKLKFKIIVAHVNHKKRVESDEEEQFLEDYCRKKNLVFEKMILDNKYKGNFEAYARKKRYMFFEELMHKYQANILMTAHHGDDLVETILMKLTRGSNLKGYQGISLITKKNNYQIIRPLLYVTKDDINKYLCDNNIPFFIDKTNNCDDYTRNRYRHHVLNFFKSENRDVHLKFLKFENRLEEANNYIEKNTLIAYNNCYRDGSLNINLFLENDLFIRRLIIEKIFSNLSNYKETEVSKELIELGLNEGIREIDMRDGDKQLSVPLEYYFDFTSKCNLKCLHCYNKDNISSITMPNNEIKRIIKDMYNCMVKPTSQIMGEKIPLGQSGDITNDK